METNVIELFPLSNEKNESRTPSLNRICSHHKKEIIMIDMNTQEKPIEQRFACVDCIFENPLIKYQTMENVDKQLKEYLTESERLLKQYKKEKKEKKSELFNQITQMRKNYNSKLNEICDKLFIDQYLGQEKTKESNQIKKKSIQALDGDKLLNNLQQLIEEENIISNQVTTNQKSKDSIFKKEIEHHLEFLKLYDLQDIQQSLDIIRGISIERNLIVQLSDIISSIQTSAQNEEINQIQEFELFIDQAKKYQSQQNIFDQTIIIYQEHIQKIKQIQSFIQSKTTDKSELFMKSQFSNLQNIFNDQELKKYCNIQQLENELINYQEKQQSFEFEIKNQINQKQIDFELKIIEINKKLEEKEMEYQNVQKQLVQVEKDNTNLKKQFQQEKIDLINKQQNQCINIFYNKIKK